MLRDPNLASSFRPPLAPKSNLPKKSAPLPSLGGSVDKFRKKTEIEKPVEYKKSFEKRAEARTEVEKPETPEQNLKPEERSWQPVDFSRGQILKKGIADTRAFRYELDNQLKSKFRNVNQRSAIVKKLAGKIGSYGLSKQNVKYALRELRSEGHIGKTEMDHLYNSFKM